LSDAADADATDAALEALRLATVYALERDFSAMSRHEWTLLATETAWDEMEDMAESADFDASSNLIWAASYASAAFLSADFCASATPVLSALEALECAEDREETPGVRLTASAALAARADREEETELASAAADDATEAAELEAALEADE